MDNTLLKYLKLKMHVFLSMPNKLFLGSFIAVLCLQPFQILKAQTGRNSESNITIDFVQKPVIKKTGSELSDTMTLRFNLYKYKGERFEERYPFINENDPIKVTAYETIGSSEKSLPLSYIEGSLKMLKRGAATTKNNIPTDITISLLIDRSGSIDPKEMDKIKDAIRAFIQNVPPGCLFFSWFNDDISESIQLTQENFEKLDLSTSKNTALYNAIYTKLLEFDSTSVIPNKEFEPKYKRNRAIAKRNSYNNYLIVLTDGVNDVEKIPKYINGEAEEIGFPKLLDTLATHANKVKVFTLGFGENSDDFDEEKLKLISQASGNPNGYFLAKPDSILQLMKSTITDKLSPDYEIKLKNPPGKTYQGNLRELHLQIVNKDKPEINATGSVGYAMGSTAHQLYIGKKTLWGTILIGVITGLVFLLVVMIIIQLIIPLIKNKIFSIKYVKKYRPSEKEIRKECPYCGDPINPGDLIVAKCKHIVHKVCWADFGHVCPEYGQNCNEGKQDYFDITDPFSRKNKIYYLKWVLFGLIGGFLTWIFFFLLKDASFVRSLAYSMLKMISPNISDTNIIELYNDKISALLLIGFLMGLFLTLFFAYIEDFRRKTLNIILRIALRGLIGGIVGFVAFYLGCIILILLHEPYRSLGFDWIPWILFGTSLGFMISVKSTIVWKHGVLGGLISIVFGFIVLFFMVSDLGYFALLIGFMLYGAGLGFSIATVRSSAEQYFLKIIEGKKHEETIPVHKWMSFHGGHNEVYIGNGFSCEIQMNWEKNNPEIAERHVKMYINTSRNIPVIVSLEQDKTTTYNSRIEMEPGKEYDLFGGNTFRIGNTVFQYIEKEK